MKRVFIIAIITALISTIPGCSSSGGNSNITVTVNSITINEISFEQNNIDTSFQISNDNETAVYMDTIEYKIYLGRNDKWIHVGLGARESMDVEANISLNFTNTTIIEKKLSKTITDKILGSESTMIKVDGSAWFTVGSETFDIQFIHEDNDPYNPPVDDKSIEPKSVEAGE